MRHSGFGSAQAPAAPEDFHRRGPSAQALDRIFQLEHARLARADWVVRYQNRLFQLRPQSGQAPARSTVTLREAQDSRLTIEYLG